MHGNSFWALILLYFYQPFYYRFTCRFYFENDFQQVKAEYTDFKTKKAVNCYSLSHNLEM